MDIADLEAQLGVAAAGAQVRLIAADGVFSMDGERRAPGEIVQRASATRSCLW
jgi:7-keto-8-aminopelargonate synthetase-like enzyme